MANYRIKNFAVRGLLATILATGAGLSIHKSVSREFTNYESMDEECLDGSIPFVHSKTGAIVCEEKPVVTGEDMHAYYGNSELYYDLKESECKRGEHLVIDGDYLFCEKNAKEYYIGNPVVIHQCDFNYILEGNKCIHSSTAEYRNTIDKAFCPTGYEVSYGIDGFQCIGPKRR
jgi:hypothetical protein